MVNKVPRVPSTVLHNNNSIQKCLHLNHWLNGSSVSRCKVSVVVPTELCVKLSLFSWESSYLTIEDTKHTHKKKNTHTLFVCLFTLSRGV